MADSQLAMATQLEELLVEACEGVWNMQDGGYSVLRDALRSDPVTEPLLPDFVKKSRNLQMFWDYIQPFNPKWGRRRAHVREAMTPLIEYLERGTASPADAVASEVLQRFDADGVHALWRKALIRRDTDPEGAITIARTLLESVCKHVLDFHHIPYTDKDDLPSLYKRTAEKLNLAPSQHSEDAFRRILGGCTSVVEGLGSLRNKISDAHGKGKLPVKPSTRHAQLAVNLAGAMATFIIETFDIRREGEI